MYYYYYSYIVWITLVYFQMNNILWDLFFTLKYTIRISLTLYTLSDKETNTQLSSFHMINVHKTLNAFLKVRYKWHNYISPGLIYSLSTTISMELILYGWVIVMKTLIQSSCHGLYTCTSNEQICSSRFSSNSESWRTFFLSTTCIVMLSKHIVNIT